MAKYIKLFRDDKRRKRLLIKFRRYQRLKAYLGYTSQETQIIRFKNYCQLTGASKSYYSQFALSRHSLRKKASFGLLPGVAKASW